jgi:hypothetical protein
MKQTGIGLMIGVLLGLLLSWVSPAVAQAPSRIVGTSTTGAAVPIGADSSGNLKVVCQ